MSLVNNNRKWRVRVNAKIVRSVPPDAESGRLAAFFGIQDGLTQTLYDGFELTIRSGQIIAVLGPSGSGKSVLLRSIARQIPDARTLDLESIARSDRAGISLLKGGDMRERLEILSRCGLAEAAALITAGKDLSGGESYRLCLAQVLHEARRTKKAALVLADEFASSLDVLTASFLSRHVRKLISGSSTGLVLATSRPELVHALAPDQIVVKPIASPPRVARRRVNAGSDAGRRWRPRVVRGTITDYDALSCFHYLSGRPAAHKRVYVIRGPKGQTPGSPDLAGVLVVSPPLSNVRGRNLATARRYTGSDRATAMALLNAEMECISRVIVHPIFRGSGLGVKLVRTAIAKAETPMVEALAAMGTVNPFFAKAGMTGYPVGPDRSVVRLLSAADAVGLSPEEMAAVEPVRRLLRRKRSRAARFLRRELDLAIRRTFPVGQLSRLADPDAEMCRRTARRYVYYLTSK